MVQDPKALCRGHGRQFGPRIASSSECFSYKGADQGACDPFRLVCIALDDSTYFPPRSGAAGLRTCASAARRTTKEE